MYETFNSYHFLSLFHSFIPFKRESFLFTFFLLFYISYAYELPSRCKKEIIKAVDKQGSGVVSAEALTKLLDNIGASAMLSKSEVESIIHEFGDRSKSTIHVDKMIKLM